MKTTFVYSSMLFNKRVLDNGYVDPRRSYSMMELKDKLFFNKVFIENMKEIFQKHNYYEIVDDYVECISKYCNNINTLIRKINKSDKSLVISNIDSFERHLASDSHIESQVITKFFPSIDQVQFKFLNEIIYYISILQNGYVAISYLDPRVSIYSKPISWDFKDYIYYWKSDECIIDFINRRYKVSNTIATRITSSLVTYDISKVECNAKSLKDIKRIAPIFPESSLVVYNNYIYTDDISYIIDSRIERPVKSEQDHDDVSFDILLTKDVLIEYPIQSFDMYLKFITFASKHPNVESIYITLYRIGRDPSIYYILRDAVKNGIEVYVNIELMASGETINRMWVREMQEIGIHVTTYAAGEIKVHSKLTLVRFKGGIQVAQIGTGNFHTQTSTQYTDLSLMTSNKDICQHIWKIFQIFLGKTTSVSFNKNLLVTRYNARKEIIKLIKKEIAKGSNGYIAIKCNAIDDNEICSYLSEAASSGCMMYLVVRGVCTWIPKELGKNVIIKSIVWDKLEHSRIYCFGKNDPSVYIGSLDIVTSKLDKRIETLVRILDAHILDEVCAYLNKYITHSKNSWLLLPSGEYRKEKK